MTWATVWQIKSTMMMPMMVVCPLAATPTDVGDVGQHAGDAGTVGGDAAVAALHLGPGVDEAEPAARALDQAGQGGQLPVILQPGDAWSGVASGRAGHGEILALDEGQIAPYDAGHCLLCKSKHHWSSE